jgi:hypothetical protein
MKVVDGEEAKAGKRAGKYGVCKAIVFKRLTIPGRKKIPISLASI